MLMSTRPFEISVAVMPEATDEQNHVNNIVYLRWVQEVATAHWQAIASSEAPVSYTHLTLPTIYSV